MKISIAQIRPVKGNVSANIEIHKKILNLTISKKVDAIFFPELSITGYEPELAKELATTSGDDRFNVFQEISNRNKITIGLGMPIKTSTGIHISMLIFQPYTALQIYSKQQLHADELAYFINGKEQITLTVDNKKIAPAICYESLQTNHATDAHKLGAELYLASVAKPQSNINKGMTHYPEIAKSLSMPVLMCNCVGYCDNFESAGQSAVWSKHGNLMAQLDDKNEGLLIYDTEREEVMIEIL